MWTRFHIKCNNCSKITNLRVQIPEKEKIIPSFDCPECGSKLRGVLTVNFKDFSWDFKVERGELLKLGFEDGDYFYEYSDTLLTSSPSKNPHHPIMPTMRIGSRELLKMKIRKDMRLAIPSEAWEDLKDFLIAYSNYNKPLISKLYNKLMSSKEELKYDADYHMAYFKCLNFFIYPWIDFENHKLYVKYLTKNVFSFANLKKLNFQNFMKTSFTDDVFIEIKKDSTNLIERFIDYRDSLIYVNQEVIPFSHVSVESFTSIKNFYTDCFEFLGKYSHLIFRLQNLIERGDENLLPTGLPKKILTVDDFISADNGSKLAYLKLSSINEFVEIYNNCFDSRLRNGINHFKAKVDSTSQIISYFPVTKRPKEEHQISYFDFLKLNVAIFHSVLKIGQLLKFRAIYKQINEK